jgi:hypothetical protein
VELASRDTVQEAVELGSSTRIGAADQASAGPARRPDRRILAYRRQRFQTYSGVVDRVTMVRAATRRAGGWKN